MNRTWLVLDCNYLCHRAFYAFRNLSHNDEGTGVLFGFLRDVNSLMELHGTSHLAFCFDRRPYLRETMLPGYKSTRYENKTEAEILAKKELNRQIKKLALDILPSLGFKNIFHHKGLEADDLIASVCKYLPEGDEAICVGSDHDLFQLVRSCVKVWSPKAGVMMTLKRLKQDYGVTPDQWIQVKAIGGCGTDDVPGVKGVREKTALKYIRGELSSTCETARRIRKEWSTTVARNLPIVTLPHISTPALLLQEDRMDAAAWRSMTNEYGMKSLEDKPPKEQHKRRKPSFGL